MSELSFSQQEQLLQSWINMSLFIRGNRLVSGFSFNEMIICRILYDRQLADGQPVTATELCQQMHLLKSQINKLLTTMEKEGLIERRRSDLDKRKIEIRLTDHAVMLYEKEHERIMKLIAHVCRRLGPEQSENLTFLLKEAVEAINEMMPPERERTPE